MRKGTLVDVRIPVRSKGTNEGLFAVEALEVPLSKRWLDENPEFRPDFKYEALYTAILLQHGEMQRHRLYDMKMRSIIRRMVIEFDPRPGEVDGQFMDDFLTKYQVWCALNERT